MRGDGKKNEQMEMKIEMTMKMEMNTEMEMEMEMVRKKRRGNVVRYTKGHRVFINTKR